MLQVSNKPSPAVVQNNPVNSTKLNKKPHTITPQAGIGVGVAALAAGGIYIVSKGSKTSLDKVADAIIEYINKVQE